MFLQGTSGSPHSTLTPLDSPKLGAETFAATVSKVSYTIHLAAEETHNFFQLNLESSLPNSGTVTSEILSPAHEGEPHHLRDLESQLSAIKLEVAEQSVPLEQVAENEQTEVAKVCRNYTKGPK